MKIAIIGMGVAGISVLREWTKEQETNPSIEITVFGDEETFGTGVPYRKDDENLLMNVPAEFTTMVPEDKDDYLDWLKTTQEKVNPRYEYYPRMLFGTYLKERMETWLKQSQATIIKEKVRTLHILSNSKIRVASKTFENDFDAVHLCIGNLPYQDPYKLKGFNNYIQDPFPISEKLKELPQDASVAVLGTGLTSIDLFRYFHFNRPDIKLDFYSRSGRFKSVSAHQQTVEFKYFTEENIKEAKASNHGLIPLDTYIDWFKKEIAHRNLALDKDWMHQPFGSVKNIEHELKYSQEIGTLQALLIDMNPFLTDLWMSLSETDKQEFLNKYYGVWGKLRSTFPEESGRLLLKAWESEELRIFEDLLDVKEHKGSFEFILKNGEIYHSDYLINASGPQTDLSFEKEAMPLLYQILDERILQAEAFGGVQVSIPDLSVISQKYGHLHTLKVHGHLISGIQFGNNSVDILSDTARDAVQDILQNVK